MWGCDQNSPSVCLEIGPGTGYAICSAALLLKVLLLSLVCGSIKNSECESNMYEVDRALRTAMVLYLKRFVPCSRRVVF